MPKAGQHRADKAATGPDLSDRLAEAERGSFVSCEAVEEWVASWFQPGELPPPDPDLHLGPLP